MQQDTADSGFPNPIVRQGREGFCLALNPVDRYYSYTVADALMDERPTAGRAEVGNTLPETVAPTRRSRPYHNRTRQACLLTTGGVQSC